MNYLASTYSIAAYDPINKEWGVAVQSKFLGVGALVPWVKEGVGVVATQAKTNANFGEKAFRLIESGLNAQETLKRILEEDEGYESRQVGIIDKNGDTSGYTGNMCLPYAGHLSGKNYICQGNVLIGRNVLKKMAEDYEKTEGDLADKLINALFAAEDEGGERRGKQSAALLIKSEELKSIGDYNNYIDLRVDDSLSPVRELNRLLEMHRVIYASNHKNKYFLFKDETKLQVLYMLNAINKDNILLGENENIESMVYDFARKQQLNENNVFEKNRISGEVVDRIASCFYQIEYEKYS